MDEQFIILNNGVKMPLLGLGVYKTNDAADMETAVSAALAAGYRSFDTAQMYGNEGLLGAALKQSGFSRESLFLTSKVNNCNQGYHAALRSFDISLNRLNTDYLDLFLIHWPGQKETRLQDTWQAMIELMARHRIRAIGVCNCLPRHIGWLGGSGVVPAVNQIECNPFQPQSATVFYCEAQGIAVEAWAPLNRGKLQDPAVTEIARAHGKTPAQVLLRWNVQNNRVVIPKSVHPGRIEENAAIFDFALTQEEMQRLGTLQQDRHTSYDLKTFDF